MSGDIDNIAVLLPDNKFVAIFEFEGPTDRVESRPVAVMAADILLPHVGETVNELVDEIETVDVWQVDSDGLPDMENVDTVEAVTAAGDTEVIIDKLGCKDSEAPAVRVANTVELANTLAVEDIDDEPLDETDIELDSELEPDTLTIEERLTMADCVTILNDVLSGVAELA